MAESPPFGKLRSLIPSVGQKSDNSTPEENLEDEDNSRGEKVSKKQHDVLAQLHIKPQTQLDAKILTPSKVKKVGFHVVEKEGYAFSEVENFHSDVSKTINWFADKLYERDRDVHKLATEVDKYITDYQSMKLDIELLEASSASREAIGDTDERIDDLEEKILDLERKNAILKSQNQLLSSQLETKNLENKKEAPPVATGGLTNSERTHLEELEAWAEEVNVLYEKMEADLEASQSQMGEMQEVIEGLQAQASNTEDFDKLKETVEELQTQLSESEAAYEELKASYETLEKYSVEAEKYSQEMDEYSQGLKEALDVSQSELEKTQVALDEALTAQKQPTPTPQPSQVQRPTPAKQEAPKADAMPYRLPPGVDIDDL